MRKIFFALIVILLPLFASAQSVGPNSAYCFTKAVGANDNTCASTAFVDNTLNSIFVLPGQFGLTADGGYSQLGGTLTATSNGTVTLTTASTAGLSAANIGNYVATVNWHSQNAASLPIVPSGATLVSYVTNTSITLSTSVPAATNMKLVFYSESMTGTDNSTALQNIINYALQNNKVSIVLPDGVYLVNDSLQAGWGNVFTSLCIQSFSRGQTSAASGVTLLFPRKDRYAINFQGMRSACLKGITMIGPNINYATVGQMFNSSLSSDARDWIAPDLDTTGVSSGGLNTNAPLAGVTVDARSGPSPAIPYPNLTYPSFTGITTQYCSQLGGNGCDLSSDTDLESVNIQGFGIGVASGLNTNYQGDFFKLTKSAVGASAYLVGIFNNQSRVPEIRDLNAGGANTALTQAALGSGQGQWAGLISNFAGDELYQLFDFPTMGYAGPQIFDGVYCEDCVRIGNFGSNGGQAAVFRGGNINLNETSHGQIPACFISGSGAQIIFDGTEIVANGRLSNWTCGSEVLDFRGGQWQGAGYGGNTTALTVAGNYTGGISAGFSLYSPVAIRNIHAEDQLNVSYFATGTVGPIGTRPFGDVFSSYSGLSTGVNRAQMQQFAQTYVDTQNQHWTMTVPIPPLIFMNSGGGFVGTAPTYSNDVMTFTYCTGIQSGSQGYGPNYIMHLGTILMAPDSATMFVVTSITGPASDANCTSPGTSYTIATQQQNDLTVVPGTNTFASNKNATPLLPSGVYMDSFGSAVIPKQLEYGTVASNCAITAIGRGDGYGGDALTYYAAGDVMFGLPFGNSITPIPFQGDNSGGVLSAITNSNTGTLTPTQGTTCNAGTYPLFPFPLH